MSLPKINHATVEYNKYGNVAITMNDGYVFYDKSDYIDLVDENGKPRNPLPEEIYYSNYIVFPRSVSNEEIESCLVIISPTGEDVTVDPDEIAPREFMALVEEAL